MTETNPIHNIRQVTIKGMFINTLLMILKFVAAFIGHSSAMLADAIHSFSDFLTDIIILLQVKFGLKPRDDRHDYGYGKIATLITLLFGIVLFVLGFFLCYESLVKTIRAIQGTVLIRPGYIALIAAFASIVLKELLYRYTIHHAHETGSAILASNAWHHRSDAISSIGTTIGIGCAIILDERWRILDPLTALIVSFFIMRIGLEMAIHSSKELMETSLSEEKEQEIVKIASSEPGVQVTKELLTRRIGNNIAIEIDIMLPGDTTVKEAHEHALNIEKKLKEKYGSSTHIGIHIEPA